MENRINEKVQYPIHFPIKVLGLNTRTLPSSVVGIIEKHAPDVVKTKPTIKVSKNRKYLSITLEFTALSLAHLETIYSSLREHPDVKTVL